jgi:hypothetical protein
LLAEQQAPELALQQASKVSGALLSLELASRAAGSGARSLLAKQQAPELSGAQSLQRCSKELPELRRSSGACLPLQTKETKKKKRKKK